MSTSTLEDIDLELMTEFSTDESEPCDGLVTIGGEEIPCPYEPVCIAVWKRSCLHGETKCPLCIGHKDHVAKMVTSNGVLISCTICARPILFVRFDPIHA